MHPFKRGVITTVLMFVFSIAGVIYMSHILTGPDRVFQSLENAFPLANYKTETDGPEEHIFATGFEAIGEPVSYSGDVQDFSYLPVRAKGENGEEEVYILSCHSSAIDINEIAEKGSLKGSLRQPTAEKEDLTEWELAIQAQYPDLDPRNIASIWLYTPRPSYFNFIVWGMWAYLAFGGAYTVWAFRRYWIKEKQWLKRTEAFQRLDLKDYPKAVRLVHGDPTLAPSSLVPRSIDPVYDVPATPQKKHPKSRAFAWRIFAAVVSIAVVCGVHSGLVYVDVKLPRGIVSAMTFMFVFSVAQSFLQFGVTSMSKSQQESPITKKKARYRMTAFHQYHDKVLKELGFRDIGDFRVVRANDPLLFRTIYLSPQGNTLVEVGVEFTKQFFTIETLTNEGKFLETHSLATKQKEMLNPHDRHLRQAADHEDILRALEDHDDFVTERTYHGSTLEAQFTEERFGRFLAWPCEKA